MVADTVAASRFSGNLIFCSILSNDLFQLKLDAQVKFGRKLASITDANRSPSTQTNVMIKILAILPLLERLLKTTLKKQRSQKNTKN